MASPKDKVSAAEKQVAEAKARRLEAEKKAAEPRKMRGRTECTALQTTLYGAMVKYRGQPVFILDADVDKYVKRGDVKKGRHRLLDVEAERAALEAKAAKSEKDK